MSDITMKKPEEQESAYAVHGQSTDGSTHIVGIGNLRVIITNDDGSWFAQGLEIDYATEGASLEDVKEKFADGLYETIQQHLTIYGTIKKLLQPAPAEVWQELFANKFSRQRLNHVGVHKLACIDTIEYYLQDTAA